MQIQKVFGVADPLALQTPEIEVDYDDESSSNESRAQFTSPSRKQRSPLRQKKSWRFINGKFISHRSFSALNFVGDGKCKR